MSNYIEIQKLKLELMRVESAKLDMEIQIMQREADIERLQVQIENQNKRIIEVKELLNKGE